MIATTNLHASLVHSRRVQRLAKLISSQMDPNISLLDVGCGDGLLAKLILGLRPDLRIAGMDILIRPETHIPVRKFDGHQIEANDNSFDVVMFVDALHHTDDPNVLLREAKRVSRGSVVIKDHLDEGFLSNATLRFMDWVGNSQHGVRLPYNYWKESQWKTAFEEHSLIIESWITTLGLYPKPFDYVFGRSLHFVAKLNCPN